MHGFARFGDRPALILVDAIVTHAALDALIDDAAATRGAARELVFLEARNTVGSIVEYLACLRRGDPVFLFGQDQPRLAALIEKYDPDRVIAHGDTGLAHTVRDTTPRALAPGLAVLLSTSGTTGSPKLVKLSIGNITSNALAIADYLGLVDGDRAITSLKFNYSFGMSVINAHLAVGASVILTDLSVIDAGFWELAAARGATSFSGVPYVFEVLRKGAADWAALPALRHVAQAGGRLDPALVEHFARMGDRHGWRFFVMYGQTEASPRMAYLPPDLALEFPDHIGVPISGGAFALVGPDGDVIDGEGEGELVFRGPGVMMGYAQGPADLASPASLDRLPTGDIARRNARGLYQIVGRATRFVKPFGLRINLDDVQDDARRWLADAAATGTDDLIVIASSTVDEVAMAAARGYLADRYALPAHLFRIVPVAEMPRLPTGKIDYAAILALAARPDAGAAQRRSPLAIMLSADFYRQIFREVLTILGMGGPRWESVAGIYAMFVAAPALRPEDNFRDLGGDSLSYMQVAMALEDYLGHLPDGWEAMTVTALEEERRHDGLV